ncbi:acetoin utilization protein AcuC [Pseudonocardia eucalypti]|uniref:Acetoin utilization protein AcuC n=1 Tax=Pseudonocardia eucalypti TaxID=648755 RepID=A0ABP9R5Q3_9PSEU|nr:acetoin utilization protein AcuC [Pseudonocardia eucalypti]
MTTSPAVVWTPGLLAYRLSDTHPLDPIRLDLTVRLATELGVLDGIDVLTPQPAPDEQIERVHRPEYLSAVKSAPDIPWGAGHGLGTPDNPIFHGMHEASALVCGGSLLAAREIASGRVDRAVNIAGGLHHAMSNEAAGFCVYNDCAVAISWLLDHGFERIAYVDVDVHHGDGVQAAFAGDPRVLTISVHQHPLTLWPGTGWPGEVGSGDAAGTSVNLPLPPGTRDGAWLRAFRAVVPALLAEFRPSLLVTQCGVDTHHEDPLAELSLSVDGHRAIYQELRGLAEAHANGKWLALGGGGYSLFRVVPRSWTHLMATVLDRDVPAEAAMPADWLAHTAGLTGLPLPTAMGEGAPLDHEPWGTGGDPVDTAVLETRRAVFPLHGLDPDDPRD